MFIGGGCCGGDGDGGWLLARCSAGVGHLFRYVHGVWYGMVRTCRFDLS
jgi:hypothetical protein